MCISDKGVALIKQLEGWKPSVYADSSGFPTIGYGHLISKSELGMPNGAPLHEWAASARARHTGELSLLEGTALLRSDLEHFEAGVYRLVKIQLEQCQFDALVCFTFNIGLANFLASHMLHRLNEGDTAIGFEFLKWNKARNKDGSGLSVVPGLANRRTLEKNMYEGNHA